jgi:hypothetical protein
MQSKQLKTKITDDIDTMTTDTYARWLSLLEGIEVVSKRVEQLKRRSPMTEIDWIKPLAFQKYIEERFESMKSDLDELKKQEHELSISTSCITSPVHHSL